MEFKISFGKNGTDVTGSGELFNTWMSRNDVQPQTITVRPVLESDRAGMPVEQDEHFEALEKIEASRRQVTVNRVEIGSQAEKEAKWIEALLKAPASSPFYKNAARRLAEVGYSL